MAKLSSEARRFLDQYTDEFASAREAAHLAAELVENSIRPLGIATPLIGARAKQPDSLRAKLRRKAYRRPAIDVTDTIGVRVIVYYKDDVDRVAARLSQEFEINKTKTTDKRRVLGLRDFGYRSVHLIVRLKAAKVLTATHRVLRSRWFEIQVRSILEHAWAEIEHEVVYKAGIDYPDDILRRFAALAGSLELLDGEFLALRERRNSLIDDFRGGYQRREHFRRPFDVARLLAFLEVLMPNGRGWRAAAREGSPFASGLDFSCLEALQATGLGTPRSLASAIHGSRFRYAIRTFAASQGIGIQSVSHLAAVVIAVAVKDAKIIQQHFPEIMFDPAIASLVERRAQRPGRVL